MFLNCGNKWILLCHTVALNHAMAGETAMRTLSLVITRDIRESQRKPPGTYEAPCLRHLEPSPRLLLLLRTCLPHSETEAAKLSSSKPHAAEIIPPEAIKFNLVE